MTSTKTKNFPNWNQDIVETKRKRHEYIRAGETSNNLLITGANQRWKGEINRGVSPSEMTEYDSKDRLAGKREDIIATLEHNKDNLPDGFTDASEYYDAQVRNGNVFTYSRCTPGQPDYDESVQQKFKD